jgi:ATP-dependent Zn protease
MPSRREHARRRDSSEMEGPIACEENGSCPVLLFSQPLGDPRMAGSSDGLLDAVDEEVRRITDECYAEARIFEGGNNSQPRGPQRAFHSASGWE